MNHLAWFTKQDCIAATCSNLLFQSQVANNTAYVNFIPTHVELNAMTIAIVHLFPVVTAATPLRDPNHYWLNRTLCSVLTLLRGLLGVCRGVCEGTINLQNYLILGDSLTEEGGSEEIG